MIRGSFDARPRPHLPTSTGSSGAYAISVPAYLFGGYKDGQIFTYKTNHAATGTCTLNVNGAGATQLLSPNGHPLWVSSIATNMIVSAIYQGGNFIMLTPTNQAWISNWSPTLTYEGTLGLTSASFSGVWSRNEKQLNVDFYISASGITGAGWYVEFTPPFSLNSSRRVTGSVHVSGVPLALSGEIFKLHTIGGNFRVFTQDSSDFPTGGTSEIRGTGTFIIA